MNCRLFILLIFLFSVTGIQAQGVFESATVSAPPETDGQFSMSGYVRGLAYGASPAYDFSSLFGELALTTSYSAGKAFIRGDLRLREGVFFNERKNVAELREAYAGYEGERFSLFLGNQIVGWGRTDGFNPTDNIHPNDYFFLSDEPDDQKLSNFMVRAKTRISHFAEIDIIGIPAYRPSRYRYDLFDLGTGVSFAEATLPRTKISNATFAARVNFEYPRAGFSFSWFHGYDPFYGFKTISVDFNLSPAITNQAAFYKKDALGADFSVPISSWILRGEMALSIPVHPGNSPEETMVIPNSGLSYVLGTEHDFGNLKAILQYIGQATFDYKPLTMPVSASSDMQEMMIYASEMVYYQTQIFNRKIFHQQEKSNHALMVALRRSFAFDVAEAELAGYYDLTSEEWFLKPLLKWKITDSLAATLGGYIMKGPDTSLFDYAGKVMNGIYTGMTFRF